MRYCKKPVVVEAFTVYSGECPSWFMAALRRNDGTVTVNPDGSCDIKTLEGVMHAEKTDYIIQGVNKEIYPCKPDIFEKTYEAVVS